MSPRASSRHRHRNPYTALVPAAETDNFRVFEDSIEQESRPPSKQKSTKDPPEDVPISIGGESLISAASHGQVAKARAAAVHS